MSGEYISPVSPEQGGQTPQELNAELTSVLDLLPKESIEDEAAALEASGVIELSGDDYDYLVRERRLHSGYGDVVIDRVKELVGRANITEHFREFIVDRFAGWLEQGITPDSEQAIEHSFFFLDRSRPGSGGIFDPRRAATFERKVLSDYVRLLPAQQALVRVSADDRLREHARKNLEQYQQGIIEWREQIKQLYGDEDSMTS